MRREKADEVTHDLQSVQNQVNLNDDNDIESEELRCIAMKLDILLVEQQKELDELKLKHDVAVSEILKDIPPRMHLEVFKMCSTKIPDYRMHCEMNLCSGHVIDDKLDDCYDVSAETTSIHSLSTLDVPVLPRMSQATTKVARQGVSADESCYNNKVSTVQQEAKSALGIAIILKDSLKES